MAAVDIANVKVLDNPSLFTRPLQFEITYQVREVLEDDIEWRVIYVGSADSESYDQELESVLVPADNPGSFVFVLQVDPPNPDLIPKPDLLGVTIVLLTCAYKDQEFIRVGYYVNSAYNDPEMNENPPAVPALDQLHRTILADAPRVTRFPHKFDYVNPLGETADGNAAPMDGVVEDAQNGKAAAVGSWDDPQISRDAPAAGQNQGVVGHAAFAMMGSGIRTGLNPFETR